MCANITLHDPLIDQIANALQQDGYILLDEFLPTSLAEQLRQQAITSSAVDFTAAGIGRTQDQQINKNIRSDTTLWFDGATVAQQQYLAWMESLRTGLNQRLFMGLADFECHFSHYSKGDFYQKHLDAFKKDNKVGQSNRLLSTVLYLNQDWVESDAGELLLYADEQSSPRLIVPPIFNHCILFLSDTFPHEVRTSYGDRFSIAGWYRTS